MRFSRKSIGNSSPNAEEDEEEDDDDEGNEDNESASEDKLIDFKIGSTIKTKTLSETILSIKSSAFIFSIFPFSASLFNSSCNDGMTRGVNNYPQSRHMWNDAD